MKFNLDESLPKGASYNFKIGDDLSKAPSHIKKIFKIDNVKGVFQVLDFISIERNSKVNWEVLLQDIKIVFDEFTEESYEINKLTNEDSNDFDEVTVSLQKIKEIPIQIKLVKNKIEKRVALPERFREAVTEVQNFVDNLIYDRYWTEEDIRYGNIEHVAEEILSEVCAAYDENRLKDILNKTKNSDKIVISKLTSNQVRVSFKQDDWKKRYSALDQFEPTLEDLDILLSALEDKHISIRRLATVYLGYLEDDIVLPLLHKALEDKSPVIRRTAGDCLSDKGNPTSIPFMCEALKDKNKLVRWRAARFLFELGDDTAISSLKYAIDNEKEFEVKLQATIALERILKGEKASGTVWQQMLKEIKKN